MAFALLFRVLNFSGIGLGDDMLLRYDIYQLVHDRHLFGGPNAYRFTWWIPTGLAAEIFGVREPAFILPILAFDVVGIVVVHRLGRRVGGPATAVIAALLLAVLPLDVAWSTMLTMDVILSVFSALAVLAILRATDPDVRDVGIRRRAWVAGAVWFWLAFHSKLSAILLAPAFVAIAWIRRRALDATVLAFIATAAILFGATVVVSWVTTGDPLSPYHRELSAQGLLGANAAAGHRFTSAYLWTYPTWLFERDGFGDLVFSVYPHLLVAFVVVAPLLGMRAPWEMLAWLVVVFLGMEFNVQRAGGAWVAGFRNVRYMHVFVYPLVLALGAYLAAIRARFRSAGTVALVALLAFSAQQSVSTATKTRVAFADLRTVCRELATLPPKHVYSDFQLGYWMSHAGLAERGWVFVEVPYSSLERRAALDRIAAQGPAYLVTGGGRDPYYGCQDCVPKAAEAAPAHWSLVKEFPSPIGPESWRPEPVRLWESRPG